MPSRSVLRSWSRVAGTFLSPFALFLALAGCGEGNSAAQQSPAAAAPEAPKEDQAPRIVTLGGDVTETVFALGAGEQVVGADIGSLYPPEVLQRERLPYHRQMSAEGILSLTPDLVLLTKDAGPPEAIEQIRAAGVRVETVPAGDSVETAEAKLRAVGAALDREEQAEQAITEMRAELDAIQSRLATVETRPKVLFLYSRAGMGAPMVGGTATPADSIIALAGGTNAAAELEGYRPLTPEALLSLNPDAVLMLEKGFDVVGGAEGLLALPGMADTPAGREKHFIALPDDLLLSFGPRLPEAVARLAEALHPGLELSTAERAGQ